MKKLILFLFALCFAMIGCGTYETVNGFDYSALYEIDAAQFDAVDALCMSLMDEVPVYD